MTLLNKVIIAIVLLVILISGSFNVYLAIDLHHTRKEVADLTLANTTLTTSLKNCNTSLNNQNTEISKAQTEASSKQKELNDLGDQLKQQQAKNKELVEAMKKIPAPKTCDATKEFLKKNLENLKW